MEIKLPYMPFRFNSPEGQMEITVRPITAPTTKGQQFGAAATFLQPGARALERIPLSAKSSTYSGAMQALTKGFKVNPEAHEKETPEYRVLNALCYADGVTDVDE